MANALWWVHYTDKKRPQYGRQLLSLASPDLSNPKAATKRAVKTATERLRKKGIDPLVHDCRCVG